MSVTDRARPEAVHTPKLLQSKAVAEAVEQHARVLDAYDQARDDFQLAKRRVGESVKADVAASAEALAAGKPEPSKKKQPAAEADLAKAERAVAVAANAGRLTIAKLAEVIVAEQESWLKALRAEDERATAAVAELLDQLDDAIDAVQHARGAQQWLDHVGSREHSNGTTGVLPSHVSVGKLESTVAGRSIGDLLGVVRQSVKPVVKPEPKAHVLAKESIR